jgi:hypothetical protein
MPDDLDVKVLDMRDLALWIYIRQDGTTDLRAQCSPDQALGWLRDIIDAIEHGEIGPGSGVVSL